MSVEIERPGALRRVNTFRHDVVAEMRKVTWPDRTQVRQLSLLVIALSLIVGGVIGLLDLFLQFGLVTLPTQLFGG